MNSLHDMGGMHGLGPLDAPAEEPLFHAPWEARVLAMTLAMAAWGRWNIDVSRHHRERIAGPDYLVMTYYEKWLAGLISLMLEAGLVSPSEIAAGAPAVDAAKASPPLRPAQVAGVLARGSPTSRDVDSPRRFSIGDRVRTRNLNPVGHTRLPRYARGRIGVVERDHGAHVLPDTNAHGLGECPERLYGVRFSAVELWGASVARGDSVHMDLWDCYLDPA